MEDDKLGVVSVLFQCGIIMMRVNAMQPDQDNLFYDYRKRGNLLASMTRSIKIEMRHP